VYFSYCFSICWIYTIIIQWAFISSKQFDQIVIHLSLSSQWHSFWSCWWHSCTFLLWLELSCFLPTPNLKEQISSTRRASGRQMYRSFSYIVDTLMHNLSLRYFWKHNLQFNHIRNILFKLSPYPLNQKTCPLKDMCPYGVDVVGGISWHVDKM